MKKGIVVFLIVACVTALLSRAAAQGACYPHDLVRVKSATSIRELPSTSSRMVRPALVGAAYGIRGSEEVRGRCWLKTDLGWLYAGFTEPVVFSAATPAITATAEPTQTATPAQLAERRSDPRQQAGCYPLDIATVIRDTPIREAVGSSSPLIGSAKAGEQYEVLRNWHHAIMGCWVETSAGWISANALTPAPGQPAERQSVQAACYPHDVAYVRSVAVIRISYDNRSREVRTARADERFDVIGTKRVGAVCWVEVSEGWFKSGPVMPTPKPAPPPCYPYDVAIVSRLTAAREYAGFHNATARDARAGERYVVMGSRMWGDDCWIQTSAGWLYGGLVDAAPAEAAATETELGTELLRWPPYLRCRNNEYPPRPEHGPGSRRAGAARPMYWRSRRPAKARPIVGSKSTTAG